MLDLESDVPLSSHYPSNHLVYNIILNSGRRRSAHPRWTAAKSKSIPVNFARCPGWHLCRALRLVFCVFSRAALMKVRARTFLRLKRILVRGLCRWERIDFDLCEAFPLTLVLDIPLSITALTLSQFKIIFVLAFAAMLAVVCVVLLGSIGGSALLMIRRWDKS